MPDLATAVGESIAETIRKSGKFEWLGKTGSDLHVEYTDLAPREWVAGASARVVVSLTGSAVVVQHDASALVEYTYDIRMDAVDVRNTLSQRGLFAQSVHGALGGGREWVAELDDPEVTVDSVPVPVRLGESGRLELEQSILEVEQDTDRPSEVISARVQLWRRL